MRKISIIIAAGIAGGALLTPSAASSATNTKHPTETGTATKAAASQSVVLSGEHSIYDRVNPSFSGWQRYTIQGETGTSTCKRWGADGEWWYWTYFPITDSRGYVISFATNLTHSWLNRCS